MPAKKKANPAYRKTTRNGIPVYVSTTTGRIVKGPGLKKTAKGFVRAIKHSVKRTVKRVAKAVKRNPKATYSGLVVAATSTSRSHLAARATALPFYSSIHKRGERYSLLVQPHNLVRAKQIIKDPPWQDVKNPAKRKTAPRVRESGKLVGKSKHLATMKAAQKLMPFPGAQVIQGGDQTKANTYYYLKVPGKNAAMARSILNTMAKTMTKKATK